MPDIRIVGISGSPRKDGNTAYLLQEALHAAGRLISIYTDFTPKCRLYQLCDYRFNDCLACDTCIGTCRQDDDMHKLYPALVNADGIILGSPVYFGTMTALMKRFLDRTRVLRHNNFQLADKPCAFIAVAARRNGGQETTIMEMLTVMLRHGCLIVNNGSSTSQYGCTAWAGAKGEAETDRFGIQTARGVGQRVARVAYLMKFARTTLRKPLPPYVFSAVSGTRKQL